MHQRVLRKSDLIARGVNDRFLLLLEQPGDAEDLASTADKLLAAIASASADIRTLEGLVRCSLGLAVYPATGENAKALPYQKRPPRSPKHSSRAAATSVS